MEEPDGDDETQDDEKATKTDGPINVEAQADAGSAGVASREPAGTWTAEDSAASHGIVPARQAAQENEAVSKFGYVDHWIRKPRPSSCRSPRYPGSLPSKPPDSAQVPHLPMKVPFACASF